ncbi:MAG: DNA-protecting protein DprA, partial [Gammaproteobacteria bacterium]|nr:DNA-protecting protein DprA [Gammaproteobacteria bacterium]
MMPLTSFLKPPTQRLNRNRFPRGLKEIPSPPSQLYCVGQLDICLGPKIAMVGSRAASWHG